MRFSYLCLALLFTALGASAFAAADQSVRQKGRVFSQETMTVKQGDKVVFINDDSVPHNVMSTSSGNDFNLGSQAPGVAIPVTFDKLGNVTVICAIHPRMKLNITIN
ncbi:MAG: putative blue (type 1) copper protein [Hyphomicrobiales bacterium]|jgi:plastocyanin|nr:putative blue (type 1) copper protein [Hyphomicrobiales bacterium]